MKAASIAAGNVNKKIGEGGKNMGFDDFKKIETCICKLEERLLLDLREE